MVCFHTSSNERLPVGVFVWHRLIAKAISLSFNIHISIIITLSIDMSVRLSGSVASIHSISRVRLHLGPCVLISCLSSFVLSLIRHCMISLFTHLHSHRKRYRVRHNIPQKVHVFVLCNSFSCRKVRKPVFFFSKDKTYPYHRSGSFVVCLNVHLCNPLRPAS